MREKGIQRMSGKRNRILNQMNKGISGARVDNKTLDWKRRYENYAEKVWKLRIIKANPSRSGLMRQTYLPTSTSLVA